MSLDADATDLLLTIENTYELVGAPNSQGQSIMKNLAKKMVKGKYDPAAAPKLWRYLVDSGDKLYKKDAQGLRGHYSQVPGHYFDTKTRQAVAVALARQFEEQVEDGDIDVQELAKGR